MSISDKIYSAVQSVFNGEFYPVVHPDPDGTETEVAATYGIYTIVGGASFNKLDGDADISRPRIQISTYSIDYADLKAKESAVLAAMKSANDAANTAIALGQDPLSLSNCIPNVSVAVPVGGYEANTKRFYSHADFYCWDRS